MESEIPPVDTISDLIQLIESDVIYKNINMYKLLSIKPYLKELNRMKGLDNIKKLLLKQVKYYLNNWNTLDDDYLHTCITGGPGTGKTTLANILAKIYCHLGVLSTGKVVIGTREKMIGEYLGQTAPKVHKTVMESLGGVLLIDEAYTFGCTKSNEDLYSIEFVNTLNRLLSEHKKEFVCIIAGYKNVIEERLFSLNDGLRRRFAYNLDTGNTSSTMLFSIFKGQAELAGWRIDPKAIGNSFFEKNKEYFPHGGGSTELFLTKCKLEYANRFFGKNKELPPTLKKEDISAGLEEYKSIFPKKDDSFSHVYI